MNNTRAILNCLCVSLLLSVGCSSGAKYQAPNLPAAQVATLIGPVLSIDGLHVRDQTPLDLFSTPRTTALPGRHQVVMGSSNGYLRTVLDLEAGQMYQIETTFNGMFQLTNQSTNRKWVFDGRTMSVLSPEGRAYPAEQPISP